MAFYSINKRLRGERTVYSTSVKQKNKGKIVFSKSKAFTSLRWEDLNISGKPSLCNCGVKAGDIEINAFRFSNCENRAYLVHVDELSAMLDEKDRKLLLNFLAAPFSPKNIGHRCILVH